MGGSFRPNGRCRRGRGGASSLFSISANFASSVWKLRPDVESWDDMHLMCDGRVKLRMGLSIDRNMVRRMQFIWQLLFDLNLSHVL